jgi:hypothetical protein
MKRDTVMRDAMERDAVIRDPMRRRTCELRS